VKKFIYYNAFQKEKPTKMIYILCQLNTFFCEVKNIK